MKKAMALCLAMVCLLLCACGGKNGSAQEPVEMNLHEVYGKLPDVLPEMVFLEPIIRGVDAENCEQALIYAAANGLVADEVWLIEAKSADQLNEIQTLAENHLRMQKETYKSYAPEQFAVLEDAELIVVGNYLALFVNPQAEQLKDAFLTAAESK